MEKEKLGPDWCAGFSKELAVFNKAFAACRGNGLFHILEFKGDRRDAEYCAKMEAEFLAGEGLVLSAQLKYSINDVLDGASVYFFKMRKDNMRELYEKCMKAGSVLIFSEYDGQDKNSFTISGCGNSVKLETILKALPFPCAKEDLEKWLAPCTGWESMDAGMIVNRTILAHYGRTDDSVLSADDFGWMIPVPREDDPAPVSMPVSAPDVQAETPVYTVPTQTQQPVEMAQAQPAPVQSAPVQLSVPVQPEPVQPSAPVQMPHPEKNIPAPVQVAPEPVKGTVKNTLTFEENAKNYEMLEDLKTEYQKVYDYIFSLHNTKWKILMNKIKDSIDKNDMSKQLCLYYLEISDDYTDPLYAMLYELDAKTEEFQSSLTKMVETLGCPNCGKDWNEDVTFLSPGVHFVKCPNCHSTRPYDRPKIENPNKAQ